MLDVRVRGLRVISLILMCYLWEEGLEAWPPCSAELEGGGVLFVHETSECFRCYEI